MGLSLGGVSGLPGGLWHLLESSAYPLEPTASRTQNLSGKQLSAAGQLHFFQPFQTLRLFNKLFALGYKACPCYDISVRYNLQACPSVSVCVCVGHTVIPLISFCWIVYRRSTSLTHYQLGLPTYQASTTRTHHAQLISAGAA